MESSRRRAAGSWYRGGLWLPQVELGVPPLGEEAGKKLESGEGLPLLRLAGAPGQSTACKQTPGMTDRGIRLHYRRGSGWVWASLAGNLTPAPM